MGGRKRTKFGIVFFFVIFILVCLFIFWSLFLNFESDNEINCLGSFDVGLMVFWACMDGCSNMQEILFNYSWDNESMKLLHHSCADVCFDQFVPDVGGS
ncbi:hypothetical protein LCGC14_0484720 [marine sediment metagenome]|uniref:Transmembrane protein n=1 Tax=marine sediment metagenome TaxID=412755 RepID=A0A0F9SDI0_9ZZZZ